MTGFENCHYCYLKFLFLFSHKQFLFSARTSSGLDRSAHPNLYMVNFVGHTLNPLKVELMKILKWTRVATLTTDSDIHKSVSYGRTSWK